MGDSRLRGEEEEVGMLSAARDRGFFRITVEPVVCAIFLTQTLTDSVLTDLYLKRTCQVSLGYNDTICDALGTDSAEGKEAELLVQPTASTFLLYKQLISSIVPAVLSLFLGPWSDLNGRRPLLIFPLIGYILMYILYTGLAYVEDLHPAYFLFGCIPLALLGGSVNLVTAVYCYVSDVSSSQNRAFRLGVTEGSLQGGSLIGLIIGPRIFSAAEKSGWGHLAVFGTAAAICCIMFCYVLFFVQESVQIDPNRTARTQFYNLWHPVEMVKTCIRKREGNRRTIVFLCVLALAGSIIIMDGEAQISFMFTRLQFGWSLDHFMNFSSIVMALIIFGTVVSSWVIPHYFSRNDTWLAATAFFLNTLQGSLTLASASNIVYLYYVAGAVSLLRGTVGPAVRSILSKTIPSDEIGKMFALVASVDALIPLGTSPLYISIYKRFLDEFTPSPYILSTIIDFLSLVAMGFILHIQKNAAHSDYHTA